jgi:uncharacterized membrane protein YfcA
VRWLEANGYFVTYATGVDTETQLGALASTRASADLLRRILAGSLSLVGARMLFDVLR